MFARRHLAAKEAAALTFALPPGASKQTTELNCLQRQERGRLAGKEQKGGKGGEHTLVFQITSSHIFSILFSDYPPASPLDPDHHPRICSSHFATRLKTAALSLKSARAPTTTISAANERPALTLGLALPIRQVRGPSFRPSHAIRPQKHQSFGLQESKEKESTERDATAF